MKSGTGPLTLRLNDKDRKNEVRLLIKGNREINPSHIALILYLIMGFQNARLCLRVVCLNVFQPVLTERRNLQFDEEIGLDRFPNRISFF